MAKTANDLLLGILTTVASIDKKMQGQKEEKKEKVPGVRDTLTISSALKGFSKVKEETKKSFITFFKDITKISKDSKDDKTFKTFSDGIISMSKALPDLVNGLNDLSKLKSNKVNKALNTLQMLFDFMGNIGDSKNSRKIEKAIKMFDEIGKSLNKIAKPLQIISNFLTYLGLSFVIFAAGLLTSSLLLKMSSPVGVIGVLLGTITILVGVIALLSFTSKYLDKGIKTIKGIGIGFSFLALGILGFTLSLLIVSKYLKTGGDAKGVLTSIGIISLTIIGIASIFFFLSKIGKQVATGTLVTILMAVGLGIIGQSILFLAETASKIGNTLKGGEKQGKPVKFLGHEVPASIAGLGIIGAIFIGASALFALIGIPVVAGLISLGAVTAIGISISMITLAYAVNKLSDVSKKVPLDFQDKLTLMISGLLMGTSDGLTLGLTGKKQPGVKGILSAIKNTVVLMSGIGILFTVSLTISQFAKALTAFAELQNLRVIKGYDKDGKPIFGEKVNINDVNTNLSMSISSFLINLIQSTDGLTKSQAAGIKKMARALTGKRGILSAVIDFTEALKVYAQFGNDGMIGYTYFDDQGNEKRGKVSINTTVNHMINAFTTFVNSLTENTEGEFGPDRRGRRKIKQMSKLLTGKRGILSAVIDFAQTLEFYSKYGKEGKIPVIDAEGKPTGQFLSMNEVASNIVNSITTFSKTLSESIDKEDKKEAKQAKKTLGKFDGLIKQMNKLAKSQDSIERLAASMKELGMGIGVLASNIKILDTDKLGNVADISAAYLEETNAYKNSNKRITERTIASNNRPKYHNDNIQPNTNNNSYNVQGSTNINEQKSINWDLISQKIGMEVGARVSAALKGGQFLFEFDTTKSGGVFHWEK